MSTLLYIIMKSENVWEVPPVNGTDNSLTAAGKLTYSIIFGRQLECMEAAVTFFFFMMIQAVIQCYLLNPAEGFTYTL